MIKKEAKTCLQFQSNLCGYLVQFSFVFLINNNQRRIPKSYSSFNKGTLKNHPEDLRNDQTKNIQQPESSKICTIS
jgi:hypothetical protein